MRRFHWQLVLLLLMMLGSLNSSLAFARKSHVVIDAIVLPLSEYQPTWIGLRRVPSGKYTHVPVGKSIVGLKPGQYFVEYLRFGYSYLLPAGQITFGRSELLSFTVFPGTTTLFGILQVELDRETDKDPDNYHDVSLTGQEHALSWACARRPEDIVDHPVAIHAGPNDYKTVVVKCKQSSSLE